MSAYRVARTVPVFFLVVLLTGCGKSSVEPPGGSPSATNSGRRLVFLGFDASQPLVQALKQGKLQGLVFQNPFKMGELGVRTLVDSPREEGRSRPGSRRGRHWSRPRTWTSRRSRSCSIRPRSDHRLRSAVSGGKTKKWRVMVIPKGTSHEFWKTIHAGALKAAEELGNVEVIWQGPQKEDERSQQIQLVQNAIASGWTGSCWPRSIPGRWSSRSRRRSPRGFPVVIIDSALESSKIVSYVSTDNYHGGVLAARRLGELLKGEGKIILLRYAVGSASTEEREKGLHRHDGPGVPQDHVSVGHRIRRGDLGPGPAEGAEPGHAVPRSGGRGLLPQRVEHLGMLRALEGAGMLGARPMSESAPCWRCAGVVKSFGASRALDGVALDLAAGRGPRPDRRERRGQEHADEGPQRGAIVPTRGR